MVDRRTGGRTPPKPLQHSAFTLITYADELDVLAHDDALRTAHADGLRRLFDRWREVAGPLAATAADRSFAAWSRPRGPTPRRGTRAGSA